MSLSKQIAKKSPLFCVHRSDKSQWFLPKVQPHESDTSPQYAHGNLALSEHFGGFKFKLTQEIIARNLWGSKIHFSYKIRS